MRIKKMGMFLVSLMMLASNVTVVSAASSVDTIISKMTLKQKLAQMMVVDFRTWNNKNFTEMNTDVSSLLSQYDFGGVILFGENIQGKEQTLKLTKDLQAAALKSTNKIPLIIGTDQEGGIVNRLKIGCAMPGNMATAATNDPQKATAAGKVMGEELKALGINTDFAPVVDINNNANNPVIGLRSFSDDAKTVAKYGTAMIKGINSTGVIASVKHFPGHGDTGTDSHSGLPIVTNKGLQSLMQSELLPYQEAIKNGVDMVMTGHICYPSIDPYKIITKKGTYINTPASLSKTMVNVVLRQRLGYQGVVATDALNMSAISENLSELNAATKAINAGNDLLVMPMEVHTTKDMSKFATLLNELESEVNRKLIDVATIDASVKRILTLKEKKKILNYAASQYPASALKQVGSDAHHNIEAEIANKAVTCLKNEGNVLPIKLSKNDHVLFLTPYDNEIPAIKLGMRRLTANKVIASDRHYEVMRYSAQTSESELSQKIAKASIVICNSEIVTNTQMNASNYATRVPALAMKLAAAAKKKGIIMSIAKPYDVASYKEAQGMIAVYGNAGMDPTEALKPEKAYGPNIVAGVECLFGAHTIQGVLPVNVPAFNQTTSRFSDTIVYKRGYGLKIKALVKEQPLQEESKQVTPAQAHLIQIAEGKQNKILFALVAITAVVGLLVVLLIVKLV